MLLFQEIPAGSLFSFAILCGMGMQLLGVRLRWRLLLLAGAVLATLAALHERDAVFIAGQLLLLPVLWRWHER